VPHLDEAPVDEYPVPGLRPVGRRDPHLTGAEAADEGGMAAADPALAVLERQHAAPRHDVEDGRLGRDDQTVNPGAAG